MAATFKLCIGVFVGLLILSLTMVANGATAFQKVDEVDNRLKTPSSICPPSTPCGWAVYTPFARTVDYFMKNTCECPDGRICVRTDDDLSVSAYVYRCREPKAGSSSSS